MAMQKAKTGSKSVRVDEPVLERRAGQDERKPRSQPIDDATGLRLPVLDALPFVKNDEIPARLLDVQDVLQDLLGVADGEKLVARVGSGAAARGSAHELGAASGESLDLALPLRL